MNISHNGFHADVISLETEGNIALGAPISILNNSKCRATTPNEEVVGIAVSNRSGLVGVQVTGYVELPYTGTAPTCGFCGLVCSNSNAVKVSDSGVKQKVLKVDTANKIVGFVLS